MLGMYFGRYENKIDSKGRLSIPAEFRRYLEAADPEYTGSNNARAVIVFGDKRRDYLEVISIDAMREIHREIQSLPMRSAIRQAMQKLYSAQVQPVNLDDTGRIVLNAYMRNKIGLKDKALVVGNSDNFQIWDPVAFENDEVDTANAEDAYDPNLDPSFYRGGKTFGD